MIRNTQCYHRNPLVPESTTLHLQKCGNPRRDHRQRKGQTQSRRREEAFFVFVFLLRLTFLHFCKWSHSSSPPVPSSAQKKGIVDPSRERHAYGANFSVIWSGGKLRMYWRKAVYRIEVISRYFCGIIFLEKSKFFCWIPRLSWRIPIPKRVARDRGRYVRTVAEQIRLTKKESRTSLIRTSPCT